MANELDRLRGEVGAIVAKHEATRGQATFTKYQDDPVGFLRDVLHCDPWSAQVAMAELVRDEPRTCIVSAQSIGKDFLVARLALWWVYCRRGFVLLTSVTDRQARNISMKEVRRAFLSAPSLPGELFQMELRVDDTSGILAFTSDSVERLVGWHHPRLLLALSEGQGLAADVFEAAHACATGAENKIVVYGNPTVVAGPFHTAATSENWKTLTVPATAHPNIVLGREEIAGGPSLAWMESMREEYGASSSIYRARVLSEWPDESVEGLLKRSWLLAAFARHESGALTDAAYRYRPPYADDPENPMSTLQAAKWGYAPLLAVDVSRYGTDKSIIAVVRGPVVEEFITWHGKSTTDSADLVIEHAKRLWTNHKAAPPRIVVDGGGVGGGVVDALRKARWATIEYNGAHRSMNPRRFLNRRAQDHWNLRVALENDRIALPRDADVLEEALAVEWQTAPNGTVQIIGKDAIRATLGRSTDKLDAVIMGLSETMTAGRRAVVFRVA